MARISYTLRHTSRAVVEIAGSLIEGDRDTLFRMLKNLIIVRGKRHIVLKFTRTKHDELLLGEAGAADLLTWGEGGGVHIVGASPLFRRMVEQTGLPPNTKFFDTVQQALDGFGKYTA